MKKTAAVLIALIAFAIMSVVKEVNYSQMYQALTFITTFSILVHLESKKNKE